MADEAPQAEQENAAPERPDWLPDNFQSPEALVASYGEATRKISDQGRELNELRTEFDQISDLIAQQNTAPQQQSYDQNPLVLAAQQAFDNGDVPAFLAINAQIADAVATEKFTALQQQAQGQTAPDETLAVISTVVEDQMRKTHEDYDSVRDRVVAKLNQFPGLVPDQTLSGVRTGIEAAYTLVTGETLMQQQQDSAAQAAAAEADRQQKLAATGLMGGGQRHAPVDEAHQHMQDLINMRSGTFSELLNDARK